MLKTLPFYNVVEQYGGKIYQVGGAVRDYLMGCEAKDLDLLITGIPLNELANLLAPFGKVNEVGESFGIIKMVIDDEELDIAIPRTERKTGTGHTGFEVDSDHNLPVEVDLQRRDFTINAIAVDADGNFIDPYGGVIDIHNKLIRAANPEAFIDDPLRMLRAIMFSVRFRFVIEPETLKMIVDNAHLIKEITPERIIAEFKKIVKAGPEACRHAHILMRSKITGLYESMFGKVKEEFVDYTPKAKTLGEFVYLLLKGQVPYPANYFKGDMNGDYSTFLEIKALQTAEQEVNTPLDARLLAFDMVKLYEPVLRTNLTSAMLRTAQNEFLAGLYPKSLKELNLTGDDLIELGFKGKGIGHMLKQAIVAVYEDRYENNKEVLVEAIRNDKIR